MKGVLQVHQDTPLLVAGRFIVLEDTFEVIPVDTRYIKRVLGRKADVKDSE